jgi:hypothetical protein
MALSRLRDELQTALETCRNHKATKITKEHEEERFVQDGFLRASSCFRGFVVPAVIGLSNERY